MTAAESQVVRLPLLTALMGLAKDNAAIEASVLTTYAFNGVFYEEVLLRFFERAGSRLNIVLVDARQLAAAVADPLRRPTRAGKDYLLAPVRHAAAFHPKIVMLLSEKSPVLALGSHNATDPGFSHNEEVTAFWGPRSKGPPRGLLLEVLEYCLAWLRSSGAAEGDFMSDVERRLRDLAARATEDLDAEARFLGSGSSGSSMWRQLQEHVDGPVRRVSLIGPYFDGDLRLLNEIARALSPTEIVVGLQPDTVILENPSAAPAIVRFVDAGAMKAFAGGESGPGFAHGKAFVFETDKGPHVAVGSANPTAAAWLDEATGNAEANLLLVGAEAKSAVAKLGLNALIDAPPIAPSQMTTIAERSVAQRRLESQQTTNQGPPVIAGIARGDAIVMRGLDAEKCRRAVRLRDELEVPSPSFSATAEGVALRANLDLRDSGLLRVEGADSALAIVVVNDEQSLRTGTRAKDAQRLLDNLGRLDSYDGFDEVFDLLQRHVFAEPEDSEPGATKSNAGVKSDGEDREEAKPDLRYGPRGISIASIPTSSRRNRLLENGLVSEVIAALIRALGPTSKSEVDGDARNIDVEDTQRGEFSSDDLAQGLSAGGTEVEVDWPRLVTACRRRLGVMINRLKVKLATPTDGPERAVWLFNRLLLVLCLLQRLRTLPPSTSVPLDGNRRATSLVSSEQLREAFKIAVHAMYGHDGLAKTLESSAHYRASEDRHLFDDALLWTAREIGADFEAPAPFNEQPVQKNQRLGDRADVVVVAMSAAGGQPNRDRPSLIPPSLRIWDDAVSIVPDWSGRHARLGRVLQSGLSGSNLPTSRRAPRAGEFAMWRGEPGLPRLVRVVSGTKAYLVEPGGELASDRKVLIGSLDAIDLSALGSPSMS